VFNLKNRPTVNYKLVGNEAVYPRNIQISIEGKEGMPI
jgi:hypothetical protein